MADFGRISKSPVVTCPALSWRRRRAVGTTAAWWNTRAARVRRTLDGGTVRCLRQLRIADRTSRRTSTWASMWETPRLWEEDAGRRRWRLQRSWTDRASGAMACVGRIRTLPYPERREGRGRWTDCALFSSNCRFHFFIFFLKYSRSIFIFVETFRTNTTRVSEIWERKIRSSIRRYGARKWCSDPSVCRLH